MSADPEYIKMQQYNQGLSERMLEAFRNKGNSLFKEPVCEHKHTEYVGEDFTGRVWISVYCCKDCGKELI
jgi:hypothetical protein